MRTSYIAQERFVLIDRAVEGKLGGAAKAGSLQRAPRALIREQVEQGGRKGRVFHDARVLLADDFTAAGIRRRKDGGAARHRFEIRQAEPFVRARDGTDPRAAVESGQICVGYARHVRHTWLRRSGGTDERQL